MICAAMKAGAYIPGGPLNETVLPLTLSACRFAASHSPVPLCLPGEADAQTQVADRADV
jgi:hypothetical protein